MRILWEAGYSARQIAEEIGGGISRNGVIGKAHRLQLSRRNQQFKTKEAFHKPKSERRGGPKRVPWRKLMKLQNPSNSAGGTDLVEPKPDDVPGRFLLVDLEPNQCRWPSGQDDKERHLFCGEERAPGTCYCERHAIRAYTTDRKLKPSEFWKFKRFGTHCERVR